MTAANRQTSVAAEFRGGPDNGTIREIECPYGRPPDCYYVLGEPPPVGTEIADPEELLTRRGVYSWKGGIRGIDPLDVPWRLALYEWKGWQA